MFCLGFELSFGLCFGLAVVLPEFLKWFNSIQVSSCLLEKKKKQNTTKVQEKQSWQTQWVFALPSCPGFLALPCWEQSNVWVLSPTISGCCGKYYFFHFFSFVCVCACACIINQNIRKIYICFLLVPGNRATL